MKILVFEDEIYNFRLLKHMLEEIDSSYYIVGPISSVVQGMEYFQLCHDVDLIIADIQLNDGLSFEALKYAPEDVPIIFTTAYDEYALQAFDYNSLSYLLKPIDSGKLRRALNKAKRLHHAELPQVVKAITENGPYRERFVVKSFNGDKVVLVENVRYIVSEQKTTYLKLLDGTSHPINLPLEPLALQMNPKKFMRVNRKYIVPVEQISGTQRMENGKMRLILKGDDSAEIIVSRLRKDEVYEWVNGVGKVNK